MQDSDPSNPQLRKVLTVDPKLVAAEDGPPERDEPSGVPKTLRAYVIHNEPQISVIPYFLTDNEIEHILELANDRWIPSVVGSGTYKTNDEARDFQNKPSTNRTSYSCMLNWEQTPMIKNIEERLAHLAGIDVDYLECLNLVRYAPGQLFNRHHDGRFRPKTVFIYLNDLPEGDGGETYFSEIDLQVVPCKGCALMWPNTLGPGIEDARTYHQGLPPKTSWKYAINCFFNDKQLKPYGDIDSMFTGKAERSVDPIELLKNTVSEPGKLLSFTVCEDPKVSVIPNFLSQEEVATLIAVINGDKSIDILTSTQLIEKRIAAVVGLPLSHMDSLRVAKCEQMMTPDGQAIARGDYVKRFGCKVFCMFLNDVTEGGEICFPKLGFQVKPREGCAVMWSLVSTTEADAEDLRASHQGRPPRSGTRYSAISVFRDTPVRDVR